MNYTSQMRWTLSGRMTPVVKKLILINCIIFVFQLILQKAFDFDMSLLFGLAPKVLLEKGFVWQIFTYLFLHGNFVHLIFNMLVLWMLGGEIEDNVFGSIRFLKYYFVCGIGAAIFNILFSYDSSVPIIGASGAIYGVLVAYAIFFGNRLLILFPFPVFIKAKYFVLMMGMIELISSVFYTTDGIAHLAHLGGMVVGYLYIMVQIQGPRKMTRNFFSKFSFSKKRKFQVIEGGQKGH